MPRLNYILNHYEILALISLVAEEFSSQRLFKNHLCASAIHLYECLDGGGGVWYSLFIKKFSPLFISLKFWVIH